MINEITISQVINGATYCDIEENINNLLKEVKYGCTDKYDKQSFISGKLKNMRVRLYSHKIIIEGSLFKFFGTRERSLGLEDVQFAINELETTLKLDLQDAKICKIQIAQYLNLEIKPEEFFPELLWGGFMRWMPNERGIYHRSKDFSIKLFTPRKSEALINKYSDIPLFFESIVKYELNLLNAGIISYVLHIEKPCLKHILSHYKSFVRFWNRTIEAIPTDPNKHVPSKEVFESIDAFETYLRYKGIESIGGKDKVLNLINKAVARGYINYDFATECSKLLNIEGADSSWDQDDNTLHWLLHQIDILADFELQEFRML